LERKEKEKAKATERCERAVKKLKKRSSTFVVDKDIQMTGI
jgi:hypothetical protein